MWSITDSSTGLTNRVTIPNIGKISVVKPKGVKLHPFVNDKPESLHHLHVNAGDVVHFHAVNELDHPKKVALEYNGSTSYLTVAANTAEREHMSSDGVNLFATPSTGLGGAIGGGMGAGLLGGVLGGALLNNGGLFGNNRVVNPATVTDVQQTVNGNAIMSALGDIKASIPLAEGQVQLALSGAQMNVTNAVTAGTGAVIGAVSAFENSVMSNLNMQTQMNQKGFADTTAAVVAAGNAAVSATKDAAILAERNTYAITQAINADGDKTRALIQSIDKTNDSRMITNLSNEITELRGDRRIAEATGNITISNNNNAVANAQQQQAQQQFQILANLNAQLQALAADVQAVRQGSVVFNSGRMDSSGNQSAANTRVG